METLATQATFSNNRVLCVNKKIVRLAITLAAGFRDRRMSLLALQC